MTTSTFELTPRPSLTERALRPARTPAPARPRRPRRDRRGPQAHPARTSRSAAARVPARGCVVAAAPVPATWRLTDRGLAVLLAVAGVLGVAALVCIGVTVAGILALP